MEDTLKTALLGGSTATIISLGVLPDIVSVAVGIVTFVYFVIKIKNELTK